jgi:hypothetical protein
MLRISELPKEAILVEANYSRTGVIMITAGTCNVCNKETTVLYIDTSEGEYGPGCICKECIMKLFKEKEKTDG